MSIKHPASLKRFEPSAMGAQLGTCLMTRIQIFSRGLFFVLEGANVMSEGNSSSLLDFEEDLRFMRDFPPGSLIRGNHF